MRTLVLMGALAWAAFSATVIDRIAVVVGKHVIKTSDIDRDLRVTEFLNGDPLNEGAEAKKKSAERLIDQQLIRDELATGAYGQGGEPNVKGMLDELRKSRFGDSESRMKQALTTYGLTEEQLRTQLQWQLTVLRFIDERFRAGILVTDEDARNYYNAHRASFKGDFDSAAPSIRSTLESEQIDQQFEQWLKDSRSRTQIEYREEAFR